MALLFPALFWLVFFFLVPIASILILQVVAERGHVRRRTTGRFRIGRDYRRLLDPLYLGILWRSILDYRRFQRLICS